MSRGAFGVVAGASALSNPSSSADRREEVALTASRLLANDPASLGPCSFYVSAQFTLPASASSFPPRPPPPSSVSNTLDTPTVPVRCE